MPVPRLAEVFGWFSSVFAVKQHSGSSVATARDDMKRRHLGNADNSRTTKSEEWGVKSLPLAVLEEVLHNLPAEQVVCVCRLVCRDWRDLVDSVCVWRERCRREGFEPRDPNNTPRDWRLYYFLCKKRRNLLKNPKAENGFDGWDLIRNGGDRWAVKNVYREFPDETVKRNFATSYGLCIKCQLVDLQEHGYNPSFMDEFQPDILVSDWYAPVDCCGCYYEICVQLLSAEKEVIQSFIPDRVSFDYGSDTAWNRMAYVFRNYGRGVRYVRFSHGGVDRQFWAGHYGIRVTNSSVEVCPAGGDTEAQCIVHEQSFREPPPRNRYHDYGPFFSATGFP